MEALFSTSDNTSGVARMGKIRELGKGAAVEGVKVSPPRLPGGVDAMGALKGV
jgi:hypothetical protein